MKKVLLTLTLIIISTLFVGAQNRSTGAKQRINEKTLAERLGYPKKAKLLIVNIDDLGMTHGINAAAMKTFKNSPVRSGSVMVPCPWFNEIADYARKNKDIDLGLHLTLNSEWANFRWGPVVSKNLVPSLLDRDGYLHLETDLAPQINVKEAEAEIRAQIERARIFGLQPTHLDSHMLMLVQTKELFEMYLRVAREYKLPIRVARDWSARAPFMENLLTPNDIVIDRIAEATPDVSPEKWNDFYAGLLKKLEPGVTEFSVHIGYDDEELRAATFNHPNWGATWRQRDFEFFNSESFRRLLAENDIKIITWREINQLTVGTN
jgi:chitin disaccharide deacetylase